MKKQALKLHMSPSTLRYRAAESIKARLKYYQVLCPARYYQMNIEQLDQCGTVPAWPTPLIPQGGRFVLDTHLYFPSLCKSVLSIFGWRWHSILERVIWLDKPNVMGLSL
jgi:hypothetical protein